MKYANNKYISWFFGENWAINNEATNEEKHDNIMS